MRSVALQPCADKASKRNYVRTIQQTVLLASLVDLVGPESNDLSQAHPTGSAAMWGSTPHRDALRDHSLLRAGDVVLFAGHGRFFLQGTVTATWRNRALATHLWGTKEDGQTWELMYSLTDLQDLDIHYAVFNSLWGYEPDASPRRFRLLDEQRSQAALNYLGVESGGAADAHYLPAEAMESATDLLRRLIGEPLTTTTGRTNTILGVRPPDVVVATDRSPDGQHVPIAWVDDALNRLVEDGSVKIHPDAIGYRSAFVGAVLLTLPGAQATGSPPVITLQRPELDAGAQAGETNNAGETPYVGALHRDGTRPQRGEQAPLRDRLLRNATEGTCAICGVTYPARFLWAAHIKKRAVCGDEERRDLDNVAMLACLFGCDALFEAGYIAVDGDGRVLVGNDHTRHESLAQHLDRLGDRRVTPFKPGNTPYFEWHRRNVFRG